MKNEKKETPIFCCGCNKEVNAYLVYGGVVYPHFLKLRTVPFWRCPTCLNFVGCHHKTKNPLRPLGVIPTPKIRDLRRKIHDEMDFILHAKRDDKFAKAKLYNWLSKKMGFDYHTALIRTIEDGEKALRLVIKVKERVWNKS